MSQLSLFDSAVQVARVPRAPDAFGHELSPEQAPVRDAGAGHNVVVAGAGTGKTELLTQRVLKLLLEGAGSENEEGVPAALEGVVALTFTNKAAAEMRSRVYRALVRRLRATDDALERARLGELRANFSSRNRIWTFDSLGATLLRLFPEHSPLPRGVSQPTAGQERALVRELSRQFWAWASLGDETETEALFDFLEMFERREQALGAIREAARRERADLERLAKRPPFSEFAEELLTLALARCEALWQSHVARVESLEAIAPRARELLLDHETAGLPGKSGGFLIANGFSAAFKKQLGESISPREQNALAARLIEWRDATHDEAERRQSLEQSKGTEKLDPAWEREWRGRGALASLARYALWWQASERALKDEGKLADFDDITRAALSILEAPEVAQTLRGEIEWLLVDEFQDTNPAQWRVVEALRRHAPDEGKGNALLVGDPKQAIYDFRGGDIRVFDAGRETLEREGAASWVLSISRRSAPPLVEWTNRAFSQIFPLDGTPRERFEAVHGPLSPVESAWLAPRPPGDKPGVFLLRPPLWRSPDAPVPTGKPSIEALRVEAANALSSWLLELLADAQTQTQNDTATGSTIPAQANASSDSPNAMAQEARTKHALPANDSAPSEGVKLRQPDFASVSQAIAAGEPAVAVLFGDNSVKAVFEGVLRARGVPFVSVRGRGFFRSDAVRWSVSLWRALLDEGDEAAMIGLLRSPFGGQSDVSLLERRVAQSGGDANWTPLDELDGATKRALESRLREWRTLSGTLRVSQVMEHALQESEIAWFEAACEDAAQRRENWGKVLDLVRGREDEGEGGLRALVDFFEAHADDDSEPLAPLPSGGAIQLMTVHSSKGLGFPCCVLAQLETPKRDGGDHTLLWGELNGQTTAAFSFAREREDEAVGSDKAPAPLAFELLKREAAARGLAEWKRLFYVACTRAQSHLVLLETDGNAPATSWHALARPALAGLEELRPAPKTGVETSLAINGKAALTGQLQNLARVETLRVADDEPEPRAPFPVEPPARLEVEAAPEAWFDDLWGARADLSPAAERLWVESRLRTLGGDAANVRQDVPFGARGAKFGLPHEWILGAWPWLAPLPGGAFVLAVSGQTPQTARTRAGVMRQIALEAGLGIEQCFALWKGEGNTVKASEVA